MSPNKEHAGTAPALLSLGWRGSSREGREGGQGGAVAVGWRFCGLIDRQMDKGLSRRMK